MGCLLMHICVLAGMLKFLLAHMLMTSKHMYFLMNGRFSILHICTDT